MIGLATGIFGFFRHGNLWLCISIGAAVFAVVYAVVILIAKKVADKREAERQKEIAELKAASSPSPTPVTPEKAHEYRLISEMLKRMPKSSGSYKLGDESKPASPLFTVLDVKFERYVIASPTYKLKMRVVLRNDTGQSVELGRLSWRASSDQMQLQPPLGYGYHTERRQGSWERDDWQPEFQQGQAVSAGGTFRLWIGVSQFHKEDELRKKHERKQLGALIFQVKIGDLPSQVAISL